MIFLEGLLFKLWFRLPQGPQNETTGQQSQIWKRRMSAKGSEGTAAEAEYWDWG